MNVLLAKCLRCGKTFGRHGAEPPHQNGRCFAFVARTLKTQKAIEEHQAERKRRWDATGDAHARP